MDAGPGANDPFCGGAAYDGHDGLDIRLRSLRDLERGVSVVAALGGTVRGGGDGMEDRLANTPEARAAVKNVECGNGVVIEHPNGLTTQYCHMRKGSVRVRPGQRVEVGEALGDIGASGLAEFPHVHLSVRRGEEKLDPLTGRAVGSGCRAENTAADTLFAPDALAALTQPTTQLMDGGLAGAPVDYAKLVVDGAPAPAKAGDGATIAWGWFANLRKGDAVRFRLRDPAGVEVFDNTSAALESSKAVYSAHAGLRRPPAPGEWTVEIDVLRDGSAILSQTRRVAVAN